MTHTNFTLGGRAGRLGRLATLLAALASPLLLGLSACSPMQATAPPASPATTAAKRPPAATLTPTPTPTPTAAAAAAPTPTPTPAPASAHGAPLLHIDTTNSLIAVTVRRGGMLARLGHDHVVAAHNITGTVSPSQNRADFQFRLDELSVDEAPLRKIAGLDTQPSADAIAGTRHNMLSKVLDAERYPLVTIHAERSMAGQPLQVAITLHGVTRTLAIPVTLHEENGSLKVQGTVTLRQSDFGIVPFSVMAGAMAVQDQMELRFDLNAR
jgi:polyisoprenoid-binding protein YceI